MTEDEMHALLARVDERTAATAADVSEIRTDLRLLRTVVLDGPDSLLPRAARLEAEAQALRADQAEDRAQLRGYAGDRTRLKLAVVGGVFSVLVAMGTTLVHGCGPEAGTKKVGQGETKAEAPGPPRTGEGTPDR